MKARIEKKIEAFEPYDLIIGVGSLEDEEKILWTLEACSKLSRLTGVSPSILEGIKYLQDVINLKITK